MSRFIPQLLLGTTLFAANAWSAATVLENFDDLVDGSTFFGGDWTTDYPLTGSTTPQSSFVQGSGTYSIEGSSATNRSSSYFEVHFSTSQDLGSADAVFVTAQALIGNAATSFEVRLFDDNGASAFATFAASRFSGNIFRTAAAHLIPETEFDPTAVKIMRVSGARLDRADAFKFTFDEIALTHPALAKFHSADTNLDAKLNLSELLRMIELYNTRFGSVRTGRYKVDPSGIDGFSTDDTLDSNTVVTLTRHHSADSNRDAKLSLSELLRVIELYNFREGTTRTGAYKGNTSSVDGFTSGPLDGLN